MNKRQCVLKKTNQFKAIVLKKTINYLEKDNKQVLFTISLIYFENYLEKDNKLYFENYLEKDRLTISFLYNISNFIFKNYLEKDRLTIKNYLEKDRLMIVR